MNILVAGSSGFIGQKVCLYLRNQGHLVKTLVRRAAKDQSEITWHPDNFEIPANALQDIDAVINLSGKNIAEWLWTANFKQELYSSRIKPTRTLAIAISKLTDKKLTFISTSGIGIYGSQLSQPVTEESKLSTGFFPDLAGSWEREALAAQSSNHRVAVIRMGVVLGKEGGLVKKLAPTLKLGLGVKIGKGDNWISWVSVEDVCRAIEKILQTDTLSGPINLVYPKALMANDFYDNLARAFGHSVLFRLPSFLIQPILGEFADETIFASQQVLPKKLLDSGFEFIVNSPQEAALSLR